MQRPRTHDRPPAKQVERSKGLHVLSTCSPEERAFLSAHARLAFEGGSLARHFDRRARRLERLEAVRCKRNSVSNVSAKAATANVATAKAATAKAATAKAATAKAKAQSQLESTAVAEISKASAAKAAAVEAATARAATASTATSTAAIASSAKPYRVVMWVTGALMKGPAVSALKFAGTRLLLGSGPFKLAGWTLVGLCAIADLNWEYFLDDGSDDSRPEVPLEPTPLPRVQVVRESKLPIPKSWELRPAGDVAPHLVKASEEMRRAIEAGLHATAHDHCVGRDGTGQTRRAKVVSVHRIENLALWKQYWHRKSEITDMHLAHNVTVQPLKPPVRSKASRTTEWPSPSPLRSCSGLPWSQPLHSPHRSTSLNRNHRLMCSQ